jgi:hypothetical protein
MGAGGGGVDGRGRSGSAVCAPDAAAWTTGSVSLPEGGGVDGEPAAKTNARWRRSRAATQGKGRVSGVVDGEPNSAPISLHRWCYWASPIERLLPRVLQPNREVGLSLGQFVFSNKSVSSLLFISWDFSQHNGY